MRTSTHCQYVACKQVEGVPNFDLTEKELRVPKTKDSYASRFARKGGQARAKKLTADQRKESARKAAQARWAKYGKK
jgi:hypothetical protein